ncbi:MAG TPA: hypothetical protein VFC31_06215 [Candidatus Limnocylindria bacterium]|nr:hypothetical protein [Candidatus Limnocylindria bacterium]
MSETAEFPLPFDASPEERETAKREIGKHTRIVGDDERAIRFEGQAIGQTGPVWHFQYTRLYRLPNGYLVAARDLHEGVKVAFARDAESLPAAFANPVVSEFIEDELRFRKVIGTKHGTQ